MTLQIILGILIRHALTTIGGGAFVEGLLTGDFINQAAGAVTTVIGLGLSALNKRKS